jgi:hypothetical protein
MGTVAFQHLYGPIASIEDIQDILLIIVEGTSG